MFVAKAGAGSFEIQAVADRIFLTSSLLQLLHVTAAVSDEEKVMCSKTVSQLLQTNSNIGILLYSHGINFSFGSIITILQEAKLKFRRNDTAVFSHHLTFPWFGYNEYH